MSIVNIAEFYGPPSLKHVVYHDIQCGSVWIRKTVSMSVHDICPKCRERTPGMAIFEEEQDALRHVQESLIYSFMVIQTSAAMEKASPIVDRMAPPVIPKELSFFESWLNWKINWPTADSIGVNRWEREFNTTAFRWGPKFAAPDAKKPQPK